MKFIIDEDKWLRLNKNSRNKDSMLYRPTDRKMCCLGFVATQCGASKKDICGIFSPAGCLAFNFKWPKWMVLLNDNTKATSELMSINDSPDLSDEQKKRQIRKIFKDHGDQIIFKKNRKSK